MGIETTPYRYGATQKITTSATSATATAVGSATYAVRLVATAAVHVHVAQPAVAATTSDPYIAANAPVEYVRVSPGDIITVIQDSAGGFLYITELTL